MCASHHANSFGVYQNLALQDYIESSLILLMQVTFVLYKLTIQLLATLICLRIMAGCFGNNFYSMKNNGNKRTE